MSSLYSFTFSRGRHSLCILIMIGTFRNTLSSERMYHVSRLLFPRIYPFRLFFSARSRDTSQATDTQGQLVEYVERRVCVRRWSCYR